MKKMYMGGMAHIDTIELWGLSTETKPLDVPDCSIFLEKDTGEVYVFESSNKTWYKL